MAQSAWPASCPVEQARTMPDRVGAASTQSRKDLTSFQNARSVQTTVHRCQNLRGSLGRNPLIQQAPFGSGDIVNQLVDPPTDAHGIEGSYAEGGGGPRTQNLEQGERRTERPQRILPREARPAGSDAAQQVGIHPFAEMGA